MKEKKEELAAGAETEEVKLPKKPIGDKPVAVAYVGPKINGLIQQFDVFSAGIPQHIAEYIEEHTALKVLFVPLEDFAEAFNEIKESGSVLYTLYEKVKEEINEQL